MPQLKQAGKKERLTLSLSHDSVKYLKVACAQTKAPSMSAYFETVVRELRAKTEMEIMEANMASYYDNLSAAEIAEQNDWGRIGAASVSQIED